MRFLKASIFATACILAAAMTLASCGSLGNMQQRMLQRKVQRQMKLQQEYLQNPEAAKQKESWYRKLLNKIFPKSQKPRKAQQPIWMGTVVLVNEEHRYALIDANVLYAALPGRDLIAVSSKQETAKLRISPDKNPPFFIADIVSGTPQVGNRVYSPETSAQ